MVLEQVEVWQMVLIGLGPHSSGCSVGSGLRRVAYATKLRSLLRSVKTILYHLLQIMVSCVHGARN